MTIQDSKVIFPLTIEKLKEYNTDCDTVIENNKEQIQLLFKDIKEEIEAIKLPDVNAIRKNLKKKSKKFILSKSYCIGNMCSFGANTDGEDDSYRLIMLPYMSVPNASIKFRYYPKSRTFVNLFNKLLMALRTEKIKYEYTIDKGQKPNYIHINLLQETQNDKFWYVLRLWSRN